MNTAAMRGGLILSAAVPITLANGCLFETQAAIIAYPVSFDAGKPTSANSLGAVNTGAVQATPSALVREAVDGAYLRAPITYESMAKAFDSMTEPLRSPERRVAFDPDDFPAV